MLKLWSKLSILSRYYLISMFTFLIWWTFLFFVKIEFINILFFTTSFIWHIALLTPGLKEKMLTQKQRYSFINIIVRTNYYLPLFIKFDKWKFGSSIVRSISPTLFTLLLVIAGGSGNLFFSLLGSFAFESVHYFVAKKIDLNDIKTESNVPPELPKI
jgi:hypothetical protein